MYCLNMKVKKPISNELILKLYSAGWSINDIVAHYTTSVSHVRSVLQKNGIATRNYRSVSDFSKECIMAVIPVATSIRQLADILDVSDHLIRHIMRCNQVNVSSLRGKAQIELNEEKIPQSKWNSFRTSYILGERGFFKCAEEFNFSVSDCVEVVLRLSSDDVKKHKENLTSYILSHYSSGLSPSSVAKQIGVSTAIVKRIFVEHPSA